MFMLVLDIQKSSEDIFKRQVHVADTRGDETDVQPVMVPSRDPGRGNRRGV